MLRLLFKPFRIINHRVRSQGVGRTVIWAYARGMPKLTGRIPLRYSQVTDAIFVGPQYGKQGKRQLEQAGVQSSVNLRTEFDDAAHGLALAHYLHLPTVDETPPALEDLQTAAEFIQARVAAGDKVYIHCAGGVGRAPTTAAAYFISQGMSVEAALQLIEQARPFIDLLPAQRAQLAVFAQRYAALQEDA